MKTSSTICIALVGTGAAGPSRVARQQPGDVRRYDQLTEMMHHHNRDFDERKYWTYGCNCLILGDRPMSDPGHGPPIDALDSVCKAYKDCVKCARMEFGETCIGEFIRYRFGYTEDKEITCRDKANSCERSLCECDARFARDHFAKKDVFDPQFHMFWSTNDGGVMWDPEDNCPRGGGGPYLPKCCAPRDGNGPFLLYNGESRHCCPDGRIVLDPRHCQQQPGPY